MIALLARLHRALLCKAWALLGPPWLRAQGVQVGSSVRLFGFPIVSVSPGSRIDLGAGVTLCSDSRFTALGVTHPVILRTRYADSHISIGENTGISGGVVYAALRVEIGRDCLLGADVMVLDNDFHPLDPGGRRQNTQREAIGAAPVIIEDNVFIGTGARILKGVRIGRDSVIGAGAIVTRDVPPGSVVVGPAASVVQSLDTGNTAQSGHHRVIDSNRRL